MLTVVIPALNVGHFLEACLDTLEVGRSLISEVIVVDGGSSDDTVGVAERRSVRLIVEGRGRGRQLRAGASAASSEWLLFLHADTMLGPDWAQAAERFMRVPGNAERAAAFRFVLDESSPAAARLDRIVAWRCRALGLSYGDQGLLISRGLYERLGGYKPLALMEDVDLVRRIGRNRLTVLDVPAVTSARRYQAGGYWRRPLRNLLCLSLYFAGVPPHLIARLYG